MEKNVTVVSKALIKAGRFFEANGLDGCSKIASCVRDQVQSTRPIAERGDPTTTTKLGANVHDDMLVIFRLRLPRSNLQLCFR